MIDKVKVGTKIICASKFDLGFVSCPRGKKYLVTKVLDIGNTKDLEIKIGRRDGEDRHLLLFKEEFDRFFTLCQRPLKNIRVL